MKAADCSGMFYSFEKVPPWGGGGPGPAQLACPGQAEKWAHAAMDLQTVGSFDQQWTLKCFSKTPFLEENI